MTDAPRMELTCLIDRPDLIVTRGLTPQAAGVPVVVFAAAAPNARTATVFEFISLLSRLDRPVYWIAEPGQSWFAAPGLVDRVVDLITTEMAHWGVAEVDTLGNSMGGYGAIAFAERLPVRTAVALGPRYSPDDRIVPDARLKQKLRRHLDRFPFPTVVPGLAAAGHAVVLHGDGGPDRPHVLRLVMPAHAEHWVVPRCGHFVGKCLRERNVLFPVIAGALSQDWPTMRTALKSARARPAAVAKPAIRRALFRAWARDRLPVSVVAMLRRVKAIFTPKRPRAEGQI